MSISVVIPCYNEEKNLNKLINKSIKFIKLVKKSEVILVNNGSTDNSAKILNSYKLRKIKNLKIINIQKNIGYGHGIKAGLKNSKHNLISWTHADLQCDIFDIYRGYKILIKTKKFKNYFIKGERINRNKFDQFFTLFMSFIANFFLKSRMSDINAQPKIFHKKFLKIVFKGPNDFNLDLFVYDKLLKINLKKIGLPVDFKKRNHGISKGGGSILGKFKLSIKTLKYIYKNR